jgi:hypothetical protein
MPTALFADMAHASQALSVIVTLGLLTSVARVAQAGDRPSGDEAGPSTVREARRLSLSVATPWPVFANHDATIPLPSLRIGVEVSPRVACELTGGTIPFGYDGRMTLLEAGLRVFMLESTLAPYGVARAGIYFDDALEQGPGRNYPYLQPAGIGLDYSGTWGFTASAEIGPTLMWYQDVGAHSLEHGVYVSVSLGYRVRTERSAP